MSVRRSINKVVSFDAAGQTLGRLSTQVAVVLRGKNLVSWQPNQPPLIQVVVTNVGQLRFTGTKLKTKRYFRFSGYPGGLKVTTLEQEFKKDPVRLFRRSVAHMLPKNRLSATLLRQLVVHRGAIKEKKLAV